MDTTEFDNSRHDEPMNVGNGDDGNDHVEKHDLDSCNCIDLQRLEAT